MLASQNPIELEGTYPLPEAQLDRFLFKLTVSDVSVDVLDDIISTRRRGEPPVPAAPLSRRGIVAVVCRDGADVLAAGRVAIYRPAGGGQSSGQRGSNGRSVELCQLRRQSAGSDRHGRGRAGLRLVGGRPSVGFEDVRAVAPAVMNHRLILNYKARFDQLSELAIVQGLLDCARRGQLEAACRHANRNDRQGRYA